MSRFFFVAIVSVAVIASWLGAADTRAAASDPDLVVVYLSGWRSEKLEAFLDTWGGIHDAIEDELPGRTLAVPYSYTYQPESYESPPTYSKKDTNQSISVSADALDNQLADLRLRYPKARFLLVGHSLGGVVATYWAGSRDLSPADRIAGIVTLDSPVDGVAWADVHRSLVLAGAASANPVGAVGLVALRVIFELGLGDGGPLIDELDRGQTPQTFQVVKESVPHMRSVNAKVYNGFECWDLFILCRRARLTGAEWHEFKLAPIADCRAVPAQLGAAHIGNRAPAPDFEDPAEAGASAKLRPDVTVRCYNEMHGRILQVPETGAWIAGIARSVVGKPPRDVPTPEPTSPTPLERTVRDIDWLNREYHIVGSSVDETVTVRNGEYSRQVECCGAVVRLVVQAPIYGDMTGDGREEVAISMRWNHGGNFSESTVAVFGTRGPDAVQLGTVGVGHDMDGDVRAVRFEPPALVINRSHRVDGDGHAAGPSYARDEYWQWDGSQLVENLARRTISAIEPSPTSAEALLAAINSAASLGTGFPLVGAGSGAMMECQQARPSRVTCIKRAESLPESAGRGMALLALVHVDFNDPDMLWIGRYPSGAWGGLGFGEPTGSAPIPEEPAVVCATGGLNVRGAPGSASPVVDVLQNGAIVTVVEFSLAREWSSSQGSGSGWYRLEQPAGWVSSDYVLDTRFRCESR